MWLRLFGTIALLCTFTLGFGSENYYERCEWLAYLFRQELGREYLDTVSQLYVVAQEMLKDSEFLDSLPTVRSKWVHKDKWTRLYKGKYILKKRRTLSESYAWEFASILGFGNYFVPSFPIEIKGHLAMLQPCRQFEASRKAHYFSISLENYWRALICTFLFGMNDLRYRNLGLANEIFLFFDNETLFSLTETSPRLTLKRQNGLYNITQIYRTHAFDFPQYEEPLTKELGQKLKREIKNLKPILEKLLQVKSYFIANNIISYEEHLLLLYERWKLVASFPFLEGNTFDDFYRFLYPQFALGFAELRDVVQEMGGPQGWGAMLEWIFVDTNKKSFLPEHIDLFNRWAEKYLDFFIPKFCGQPY